jgi:hypothetical protein
MACVRPLVIQRLYQLRAPQSVRAHTACPLNREVKYAEIEVEEDDKKEKVEKKGG